MRVVIQRVSESKVDVDNITIGSISKGLLVLLGITHEDTQEDIDYILKKIIQLRIFNDTDGKMNLSLEDVNGEVLVVSQFTLHAKTKKGNRPSYIDAAHPDIAIPIYEKFVSDLKSKIGQDKVATGEFGAMMQVSLVNAGPVTIIIDSKDK